MTQGSDYGLIQDILLAVGLFGGIIIYRKQNIPQQTIKNLQDLTDSQTKSIAELKEARITDARTIGELQGQVKSYKELPLRELADGIKEVVNISRDNATSNQKILETLQTTAKINAEDRDVLTNQNLHIKTEVHREMDKTI
jgi:hypothetical protein